MTKIISVLITFLLLSCGKAVEDKTPEAIPEEETFSDGVYQAVLIPVNGRISSQINGEVKISRYGDDFKVRVELKNAPKGIHKQFLHTGTDCPRQVHDDNHDGFVDGYESQEVMGQILVPFDGDLSSQSRGDTFYPSGSYSYARSTSYYLMLSDLHLPDEIVNDSIVKLHTRDLPLEKRVVSIYGQSSVGEIPIACGVLTHIANEPPPPSDGDSWEDDYPRPRNPVPRPRPRPEPRPQPDPDIEQPRGGSWWDNLRNRWERWRGRMEDWWNGGD